MGHKNRGNSKFWSQKKVFPPGLVTLTLSKYVQYNSSREISSGTQNTTENGNRIAMPQKFILFKAKLHNCGLSGISLKQLCKT